MPHLALCLLGPPAIELNHQPVELTKQKALALLAYLGVTRSSHRRDHLATLLWPEYGQHSARTYLRQALYELNQRLGEHWFIASRETIGVAPETNLQVDVQLFLDHLASVGKRSGALRAADVERLRAAIALYRADFLAGFTLPDCPDFDEWQFFQTEQLRRSLAEALQTLIQWHISQQTYQEAIAWARRWLSQDALHEPAHRVLMELYAWSGQSAAALHHYAECVRLLEKELGVPPDQETTALYEAIKIRRFPSSVQREQPPERSTSVSDGEKGTDSQTAPSPASNLPLLWSPLIGREDDLVVLDRLFANPALRLITLVGPGGMGKTRLAVATAERQHKAGRFPDGVYFASLAPLSESEAIVPAIAEAVGFLFELGGKQPRMPKQQLLDYLHHKQLLLVLDNFEHLPEAVPFVLEVLQRAPDVRILVTSRERLQLHDEQIYPVHGLAYPVEKIHQAALHSAASELFLQRARRVQPEFEPSPTEWIHLHRICQLVEGMPLGLELAASWVDVLPLAQIADEIVTSLDFLQAGGQDVPVRHRSIRAVFDTTWQRLDEAERVLFAQLSVFRGGFTRQAAQQVTSASLPFLSALAAKSLIHFDKRRDRYGIHELLRQYGAGKLAEQSELEQTVHNRQSAYYCTWLQQWETDLKGARQREVLTAIEAEHENVRMAWRWAQAQGQWERIRQAMDSLGTFYEWQGRYEEGNAVFQTIVAALEHAAAAELQPLLAKALAWRSVFMRLKGPLDLAHQGLQRSLALLEALAATNQDTRSERAFVFLHMGHLALEQDNALAQAAYEQSLALYRAMEAPWETAAALVGLGQVARFLGDYRQVQTRYEESLALYRTLGDQQGIAMVLDNLSLVARYQGRLEESEQLARQSYHHYQQVGNRSSLAKGLFSLAQAVDWLGKSAEALTLMQEAIDLYEGLGNRRGLTIFYTRISNTEVHLGHYEKAQTYAQRGLALAQEFGDQRFIGLALEVLSDIAMLEGRYAEAERLLKDSLAAYQTLGVRAEEGRVYVSSAYVAWKQGKLPQTQQFLSQGLQIGLDLPDLSAVLNALAVLAVVLAEMAEIEYALELDALCRLSPAMASSQSYEILVGRSIAAAAASLPPPVLEAAKVRGQSLDLWQAAGAWLDKLQAPGWNLRPRA